MSDSRSPLQEDLLEVMDRKDHWAWPHFNEGRADHDQLLLHFQQEYEVYVRDDNGAPIAADPSDVGPA